MKKWLDNIQDKVFLRQFTKKKVYSFEVAFQLLFVVSAYSLDIAH